MNTLKTGVLMAALFGLFMLVGQLIGGQNGMMLGFMLALGMNFFAYWFSDKLASAMSGAREIDESQSPGLFGIIRRLTQQTGLPMPRIYVIPSAQPNAFATGRNPEHAAVAVTAGILQALTDNELEAVLAHELAHVKHRDILISTVAATAAGAISFLVQMLQFRMLFGGGYQDDRDREGVNPLGVLLAIIVAPIAALLIQLAISRTREFDADRGGSEITHNPLALASALRKIERYAEQIPMNVNPSTAHMYIANPLGGDRLEGIAKLFRTHPPTEERIARLEEMAGHGREGQFRAA